MIRCFFLLFLIFSLPVQATEIMLCDEMQKPEVYKKNKHYYKMVEGVDGWLFRTKTDFQTNFKADNLTVKGFRQLNQALLKQDIQLVIALLPTRGMMHYDQVLSDTYNKREVIQSYLNLVTVLERGGLHVAFVSDFENVQDFYYERDHHWSAVGANRMAQAVAQIVTEFPIYNNIQKKEFKTEFIEEQLRAGSFSDFVEQICKNKIADELVKTYKTYPIEENALFEDETKPEVVLIGTSNSDQKASNSNFEGFLKERLSVDVLNLSVSGGGFDTALLQWLASEEYKNSKPKVIIWEFPVYQDFRDESFFKQVVPAVQGECSSNVQFVENLQIEDNKFEISLGEALDVSRSYISLSLPEFTKSKLRVSFDYDGGQREVFDFKRSKFYEADGKFFLDIKNNQKLLSIKGVLPEGEYSASSLQVCRYSSNVFSEE